MTFPLHDAPLWLFSLCALLGLLLHVAVKVDAWWKPEFLQTGVTLGDYFREYPVRTFISVVSSLLVSVLLWEYGYHDPIAAAAAGYINNSFLDGLLGTRKIKP